MRVSPGSCGSDDRRVCDLVGDAARKCRIRARDSIQVRGDTFCRNRQARVPTPAVDSDARSWMGGCSRCASGSGGRGIGIGGSHARPAGPGAAGNRRTRRQRRCGHHRPGIPPRHPMGRTRHPYASTRPRELPHHPRHLPVERPSNHASSMSPTTPGSQPSGG